MFKHKIAALFFVRGWENFLFYQVTQQIHVIWSLSESSGFLRYVFLLLSLKFDREIFLKGNRKNKTFRQVGRKVFHFHPQILSPDLISFCHPPSFKNFSGWGFDVSHKLFPPSRSNFKVKSFLQDDK